MFHVTPSLYPYILCSSSDGLMVVKEKGKKKEKEKKKKEKKRKEKRKQ